MTSHNSLAASIRREKELHPESFCAKCLWRIKTAHGDSPCKNHPVQPAPVAPSIEGRPCNHCDRVVGLRVEVRTPSQRLVVCAICAVELARTNAEARIVAHQPPMTSLFVCSDEWYSPNALDAKLHQDDLNAEAQRFAERVSAYVARQRAATTPTPRSTAEARASILSRMTPKQRATFARRGISA